MDVGLPIYGFLLVFNSNTWGNLASLQHISPQNLCDVEFHLSRSPKAKSNDAIGLPKYDFLLLSSSNRMSIPHHLAVIACIGT